MKSDSILILTGKLGTSQGVGGRRWSLFGRSLLQSGLNVHLITAQQEIPLEFSSFRGRVHRFKSRYPAILQRAPAGLLGKIYHRLVLLFLKFKVKGTVYDTGALDIDRIRSLARKLIQQEEVKILICTGAPFSYLYAGALLKKEFPNLVLLSDFRDRWTNGFHYGMRSLSTKRFAYEAFKERAVLRASDIVTATCPDIIEYLSAITQGNYHLVLNPVSDLLVPTEKKMSSGNAPFTVTCAGNIGRGCEPYFEHFLSNVSTLNRQYPNMFRFVFIGNGDKEMELILDRNPLPNIERYSYMAQEKLSQYLSNADAFLLFQRPEMVNSVATKVFDYIKFRKPLIACIGPGMLSDIVSQGRLGYIMDRNLDAETFVADMIKLKEGKIPFNKNYDYSEYTADSMVGRLLAVVEDAMNARGQDS